MPLTPKTGQGPVSSLLSVKNLNVSFNSRGETIHAVNNLSFNLNQNEILGIVGESGSGKSQTVLSIMGLLESNGRSSGSAIFKGKELIGLSATERQRAGIQDWRLDHTTSTIIAILKPTHHPLSEPAFIDAIDACGGWLVAARSTTKL